MKYKINPSSFSAMFPIPAELIDRNLKLAGAVQLKTILFFFRAVTSGKTPSDSEIAEGIGYSEEDVQDALIFWEERGLLIKDDAEITFASQEKEHKSEEKSEKKPPKNKRENQELPIVKPSFEQVAERVEESDEIRVLFLEAQQISGKTIGFSGQSTLLMIHESYGLPVDVILMLLGYAKSIGRSDWSHISSLAKIWSDREIFSIEQAEEFINEQNAADQLWCSFRLLSKVNNSIPTTKQRQYFIKWNREYGFGAEMIFAAYERAVEQTGKFSLPYADKILKRWSSAGFKTTDDVLESERLFAESKGKKEEKKKTGAKDKTGVFSSDASYDLSKYTGLGLDIGAGKK